MEEVQARFMKREEKILVEKNRHRQAGGRVERERERQRESKRARERKRAAAALEVL